MTLVLEGWPTKDTEAPYPQEERLALPVTYPAFFTTNPLFHQPIINRLNAYFRIKKNKEHRRYTGNSWEIFFLYDLVLHITHIHTTEFEIWAAFPNLQ